MGERGGAMRLSQQSEGAKRTDLFQGSMVSQPPCCMWPICPVAPASARSAVVEPRPESLACHSTAALSMAAALL
jgi:hypothetical protein